MMDGAGLSSLLPGADPPPRFYLLLGPEIILQRTLSSSLISCKCQIALDKAHLLRPQRRDVSPASIILTGIWEEGGFSSGAGPGGRRLTPLFPEKTNLFCAIKCKMSISEEKSFAPSEFYAIRREMFRPPPHTQAKVTPPQHTHTQHTHTQAKVTPLPDTQHTHTHTHTSQGDTSPTHTHTHTHTHTQAKVTPPPDTHTHTQTHTHRPR